MFYEKEKPGSETATEYLSRVCHATTDLCSTDGENLLCPSQKELISVNATVHLIKDSSGKPLGGVCTTVHGDGRARIHSLYVVQDFRQSGMGRKLFAHACDDLLSCGVETVDGVVRFRNGVPNWPSYRLFQQFHFHTDDQPKRSILDDHPSHRHLLKNASFDQNGKPYFEYLLFTSTAKTAAAVQSYLNQKG